ncbi:HAMP domain-containing histidine kinase [Parabacteroides sp. OttesenSCG-928-G21]|nr:HAMP domain-containing histidine kinase [Parabacteroides sp. OttesenSCG-928-G21]
MKFHLRFKLIGILITVALAGFIAFQAYWLVGLYNSLATQMEVNIKESMRRADYKELISRMYIIYKDVDKIEKRGAFVSSPDGGSAEIRDGKPEAQSISITYDDIDLMEASMDSFYEDMMAAMAGLDNIVLQGLHTHLDTIIPINLNVYDSLFVKELTSYNINPHYQVNLVYSALGEEGAFMTRLRNHPGMEKDTAVAAFDWKGAVFYDYPIYADSITNEYYAQLIGLTPIPGEQLVYRLYIKSPARLVLGQMWGILFSSGMVLILIIAAFIYLLRTILRQRTLEELKTDFTNNMTHELKTPLAVSYAAVDALLEFDDSGNERQRKYLSIVKEQLTRLTGLVEQILTLSVEDRTTFKLQPEDINVNNLISKLIEQHQINDDKKVIFNVDLPEKFSITADRTHFYNIINNLVDNALKYTQKRPVIIDISAGNESTGKWIKITDNGPGINPVHQQRIFERFYRIPSGNIHQVKGHGLGLYYVQDMMRRHHGEITLHSETGKGSSFVLHFNS